MVPFGAPFLLGEVQQEESNGLMFELRADHVVQSPAHDVRKTDWTLHED